MKTIQSISIFILLSFVLIIQNSCSKEQLKVNKLEGEWIYQEMKYNNVVLDIYKYPTVDRSYSKVVFIYDKINYKKETATSRTILSSTKELLNEYTYTFSEDSKVLFSKRLSTGTVLKYNILELTNSKFHFTSVDEISGDIFEITLVKK